MTALTYVRYLINEINGKENEPYVTLAVLRELESELSPFAPQPIQKLISSKPGWTKYLADMLKECAKLKNKKADIADEIAKKYK